MPSTWDVALDAPSSDPSGFAWAVPLVYVDGVTISMPLMTALRSALVDVPLYVSTVRDEYDLSPNSTVDGWSWQDLQQDYFNSTFANYPAGTQNVINSFYGPLSQREQFPSQAYYDFCTDVCVGCGNHEVAIAAAAGFQSPVYLVGECGGRVEQLLKAKA